MKIVMKDYDKNFRLREVKAKNGKISGFPIRFKILKNGKEFPCCDWHGTCINKAYAEVHPKNKGGWNYLCKKHCLQEKKRLKEKLLVDLNVGW